MPTAGESKVLASEKNYTEFMSLYHDRVFKTKFHFASMFAGKKRKITLLAYNNVKNSPSRINEGEIICRIHNKAV
jgi:hypothetical protein